MTDVLKQEGQRATKQRMQRTREVVYPVSDGKPMAESDLHQQLMIYFIEALRQHFRNDPLVYVAGNNFLYWEQGNPRAAISPDTYVVFGVPMELRDCYMAWKLGGRLPDVVFEFTSKKTRREDVWKKRPIYEQTLKVSEYFQFDPTGDYLRPRLQGFRLVDGSYVPLEVIDGRLHSERLGLDLVQDGNWLRIFDPARGEWLLTPQEHAQRSKMETIRSQAEAHRAEVEAKRAESEAQRAQQAEARATGLETELEALRRRLAELERG